MNKLRFPLSFHCQDANANAYTTTKTFFISHQCTKCKTQTEKQHKSFIQFQCTKYNNADLEIKLFFHFQDANIRTQIEIKSFTFQDTNIKMQIEIKSFTFPGCHYKNAD